MKINWEKLNIELIRNFAYTTEFLALGKILLARLYLYLNVPININKKSHTVHGIVLLGFL